MSDEDTTRVEQVEELELSVHHRVKERPILTSAEYEIHAGFADVLEVPESLVHAVKTQTGVDIRTVDVQCGAEIKVVTD